MIAYIRHRMDEFDISFEQLAESLAEDEEKVLPIKYRDAQGNTWDGEGEMPDWLRRAVHAGQTVDFFYIGSSE